MSNYMLITPVKNEEKFLPLLADCIANQTILPKIWVIVDGNSNDNTLNIINKLSGKYEWIFLKKQDNITAEKTHLNFAYGVKEGYEYGKLICEHKGINIDYVGKIDSDIVINPNFFEILVSHLEENPSLGIVSGASYTLKSSNKINDFININKNCFTKENYFSDELPDKRLYRKKFLDDVGGFPLSKYSPDTILLAKFRIRGWGIKTIHDVKIYNLRDDTGCERNLWASTKSYGHNRYYLNYHPILVFANTLILFLRKPHYLAFAYILGYLSSTIKKDPKIDDCEVKNYFYSIRPKEIIKQIL